MKDNDSIIDTKIQFNALSEYSLISDENVL